ncbi:uncharacterized protein METZ01_LOCUS114124 [marine metagenome]|uniref:Uncharacterized protein n=1 Tax=marine metagenome TaxID=408172 RepID=A0A381X9H4_9ZZZZ
MASVLFESGVNLTIMDGIQRVNRRTHVDLMIYLFKTLSID